MPIYGYGVKMRIEEIECEAINEQGGIVPTINSRLRKKLVLKNAVPVETVSCRDNQRLP